MADTAGEADIRGINIDKLAKGFADEQNIMKKFVTTSTTSAREIRWYQKTSGFLDSPTTDDTSITLVNVAHGAQPAVIGQSWTRQTSYVKKFFFESETLTMEDIKDSDIDILGTTVRDVVRAVERKVDLRIFSVLVEAAAATPTVPNPTLVNNTAATGKWDNSATANPIKDITTAQRKIRQYGYDPMDAIIGMNSIEHELLLDFLISTKGSSIPQFASEKVKSGVVMNFLGNRIVVSEHFTTDYIYMWIPNRSLTYKSFMGLTSVVINDPGIGKKIRVWEEGEAILTDPKSVHITTDTIT